MTAEFETIEEAIKHFFSDIENVKTTYIDTFDGQLYAICDSTTGFTKKIRIKLSMITEVRRV